ncbi:MAG: tRNA pseudouridine(55) synthase TruB [Candidatus Glassbacteria bacterium]|nr:tRNA pseudouridine(55) synthase TruB [Candidatus Glassbacteria bacterium]
MSRRKHPGSGFCGILPVNKPAGMTSHDVVDRVRRILGERKVGHTGTLDPAAVGLLLLCVGDATRFARYLGGCAKTYRAVVRFGRTTDSCDGDGETLSVFDGDLAGVLTEDNLRRSLEKYKGEFEQQPPSFSAKKVGGVPAYQLARQGIEPDLKPAAVRVDDIRVSGFAPPDVTLELDCSAGFYIRAFARDLGRDLGTGAYLESLVRTRVGAVKLDRAFDLEKLAAMGPQQAVAEAMIGFDEALAFMPAVRLTETAVEDVFFGRQVELTGGSGLVEGEPSGTGVTAVRVRDCEGAFLGVGELDRLRGSSDVLKPRRLLTGSFPVKLRARNRNEQAD